MRLGQLARKLSIRPSQIVDFLSSRQIFFEEGSNAKLNDDQVRDIVTHFAPDRVGEMLILQRDEEQEPSSTPVTPIAQEPMVELHVKAEDPIITTEEEKPEVIKAPKIELSGLKVLGKIELPQPKKKEPVETITEPTEEPTPAIKPRSKGSKTDRKRVEEKPWRNPIAQQREREAREKEALRKAALEKEKEKKREHYLKRVKVGQPSKPVRIVEEPLESEMVVSQPRPRTWWGRFMRWLNT